MLSKLNLINFCKAVMGPGQKFLTRFGSIFCGSGRVSHLRFGFEFQKFALKMSNFSIFSPSGQKNLFGSGRKVPGSEAGQPLIYCGSKVSSGQVRAHLYCKATYFLWLKIISIRVQSDKELLKTIQYFSFVFCGIFEEFCDVKYCCQLRSKI